MRQRRPGYLGNFGKYTFTFGQAPPDTVDTNFLYPLSQFVTKGDYGTVCQNLPAYISKLQTNGQFPQTVAALNALQNAILSKSNNRCPPTGLDVSQTFLSSAAVAAGAPNIPNLYLQAGAALKNEISTQSGSSFTVSAGPTAAQAQATGPDNSTKNVLSVQLKNLEGSIATTDPNSMITQATAIQNSVSTALSATGVTSWDASGTFTTVDGGGWYSSADLTSRAQSLIDGANNTLKGTARDQEIVGLFQQAYTQDPYDPNAIVSQLTVDEAIKYIPAITTQSNLKQLEQSVVRWKGAALKQGQVVASDKPTYLINTIQAQLPNITPSGLQSFFTGKLTDLQTQDTQITPSDMQQGAANLQADITAQVKAAMDENNNLGPCAAEQEAQAIALAKANPTAYALYTDKIGNTFDSALASIYGAIPISPDSFKSCHPPRWPVYIIIGLLVTWASISIFKGTLKALTFGLLRKNPVKKSKKAKSKKKKK